MSLPVELRVLCHQLSSTPVTQLPHITPALLRNILRCKEVLSLGGNNATKNDPSGSSVLVHRIKTQVSTLLYGRSSEGRFTAVVLIKAIIGVGGWEALKGAESWVRGLLSVLGKQDPIATKRLCVLSLTSIYFLTHQYQSLVREITTPTLPTFVSSCISLISSNSGRVSDSPLLLIEMVLGSFCSLIPRYPTIFRPFSRQIRLLVRPYLAPTLCDQLFVPPSLCQCARHLSVLLHQTAVKNTSGEEWAKSIRELITAIHATTDQVYRAFIEDWESSSGYVSAHIDVNLEAQGGATNEVDLPAWNGVDAGLERLVGQLKLLMEYLKYPTATVVTIPLDAIFDILNRLMSVVSTLNAKGSSDVDGMRVNAAIERTERESLLAGLEGVHTTSIELYLVLFDRLQYNLISISERCLSQVAWLFSKRPQHGEAFRSVVYQLVTRVLPMCKSSLQKQSIASMTPIIKACCKELRPNDDIPEPLSQEQNGNAAVKGSSSNADALLRTNVSPPVLKKGLDVVDSASQLLPFLISDLPQQELQGYLRADIDRTAILARHKGAMLASVLNPFIIKNGTCLPSILPHLCREFPGDPAVEALLRPRLPIIRQTQKVCEDSEILGEPSEPTEEMIEDVVLTDTTPLNNIEGFDTMERGAPIEDKQQFEEEPQVSQMKEITTNYWGTNTSIGGDLKSGSSPTVTQALSRPLLALSEMPSKGGNDPKPIVLDVKEDDSDESIHLVMELSESEDDGLP